MTPADGITQLTLPCGCVIEVIKDTLLVTTCPLGQRCAKVRYVLDQAERDGKPTTILEDP